MAIDNYDELRAIRQRHFRENEVVRSRRQIHAETLKLLEAHSKLEIAILKQTLQDMEDDNA